MNDVAKWQQAIADLEAQIADLQKRWPAHSVPAGMVMQLDELEEELEVARRELAKAEDRRIGRDLQD